MSTVRGRSADQFWGVVLEGPDARELARFYSELLDWPVSKEEPGWVVLEPPGGGTGLSFQTSADYVPPVWPPAEGRQQMMMHLDLEVDDLDVAVESALATGATLAGFQPQEGV